MASACDLAAHHGSDRLSVVVVDDDVASANVSCRAIASLGHSCVIARDGTTALRLVERNHSDVVVSNRVLSGIDGLELCRAIRAHKDRYVYFVLASTDADKAHVFEAMRAGVDEYLTKPLDLDVLEAHMLCAQRVVRMHHALVARNHALRRDSQRNLEVSRVDPLTGARNRRALTEDLRRAHGAVVRYGAPCAVAMCDVDRFKDYNDQHGHLAGDAALKTVVQAIERELRRGDSIYRYGGEEFVALLPHQSLEAARIAMERVRRTVARIAPVTISVGLSLVAREDDDVETCIRRADTALYRAKSAGRNCVVA
jgi:diguanylate cyclase (GGDEF)-like protein